MSSLTLDEAVRQAIALREGRYALACGCRLLVDWPDRVHPKSRKQRCKQHGWRPVTGIWLPNQKVTVTTLQYRQVRFEIQHAADCHQPSEFYTSTMKAVQQRTHTAAVTAVMSLRPVEAAHLLWEHAFYPDRPWTDALLDAVAATDPKRAAIIREMLDKAEHGHVSPRAWYAAFGSRAIWQHTGYDDHLRRDPARWTAG